MVADWMSSVKMQNWGAFLPHLSKDVVSLNPTGNTIATNYCSLLFPHSSHIHTLFAGHTFPSASFNLERGSSAPQHHQDSPMVLPPHLPTPPIKPFTHTEFKMQSLGLLPRSSAQSFSTHLHATLLNISLRCPPETPARVTQL